MPLRHWYATVNVRPRKRYCIANVFELATAKIYRHRLPRQLFVVTYVDCDRPNRVNNPKRDLLSSIMFKHALYKRCPIWLQELMISSRELARKTLREGWRFRQVLEEIRETQWFDKQHLHEYQTERVVAIVEHAARNVPYYRRLFADYGLRPGDISSLEDFSKVPYLTKQQIVQDPQSFLAEDVPGFLFEGSTSGTTGAPLKVYQDLRSIVREHAFLYRNLQWAGFKEGERRAWFRGDMIVPVDQRQPPFWRKNWIGDTLMMSSYHLSEQNAHSYVAVLERFDPVVIQAYPSSIFFLARFLESKGRRYGGRNLRAIVTSSETLLPEQAAVIEEQMGCRIFDHYGALERVVMISTCEQGKLHVAEDYGYMEIENSDDGTAQIVGTGFNNWVMPLLRYRTNDRVIAEVPDCRCRCGRYFPLVKSVQGRMDEYLTTVDGRRITRLGPVFSGVQNIAEAQIVQERVGEVVIYVVPLGTFGEANRLRLVQNAVVRLGGDTNVIVRVVPEIERGPNGKFRTVINRLNQTRI